MRVRGVGLVGGGSVDSCFLQNVVPQLPKMKEQRRFLVGDNDPI